MSAEATTQAPNLDDMKVTALAPYYGGKRSLAHVIVEELGPHRSYWEPFCGSCAVLMAKPPCQHETVNDLYGDVINLVRVVADRHLGPQLYRQLRRTCVDQQIRTECLRYLSAHRGRKADLFCADLTWAYKYFVATWLGRNGYAGAEGWDRPSFPVRYTQGGGHGGRRFHSAVYSIPAWRRRFLCSNVMVTSIDAFEQIDRIADEAGTAIYVDSPYVVKAVKYLVDDFADAEHARLHRSLARFKRARVVVSYYDHELIRGLYQGWTFRDVGRSKNTASAASRGKANAAKAPEILILNGPSYAAGVVAA